MDARCKRSTILRAFPVLPYPLGREARQHARGSAVCAFRPSKARGTGKPAPLLSGKDRVQAPRAREGSISGKWSAATSKEASRGSVASRRQRTLSRSKARWPRRQACAGHHPHGLPLRGHRNRLHAVLDAVARRGTLYAHVEHAPLRACDAAAWPVRRGEDQVVHERRKGSRHPSFRQTRDACGELGARYREVRMRPVAGKRVGLDHRPNSCNQPSTPLPGKAGRVRRRPYVPPGGCPIRRNSSPA